VELSNRFYEIYGLPEGVFSKVKALGRSALGVGPLVDMRPVVEFLRQPDVFGELCLRDLNRKVCIVAFNLHSGRWGEGDTINRGWGARIFQNLRPDGDDPDCYPDWHAADFRRLHYGTWPTDLDLPLYEVMLRSGAAPVLIPMRAGHVDGAIFANNPSMAAVSEVMGTRNWINELYNRKNDGTAVPRGWLSGVQDVVVFSLGGDDYRFADRKTQEVLDRVADPATPAAERNLGWGWLPWAVKLREPLLALKLLINGDGRGIGYQTKNICAPGAVLRVSASGTGGIVRSFLGTMLGSPRVVTDGEATAARWALDADRIDALLDKLLPIPPAPPARVDRPGESEPAPPREVSAESRAVARLLSAIDVVCDGIVDSAGEETGYVSSRMKAAVPKVQRAFMEWSIQEPVQSKLLMERMQIFWEYVGPELRRSLGGNSTAPEDQFPVSYLLAALWLRVVWLTVDEDELPSAAVEEAHISGALWRVLLDPFYQMHWVELFATAAAFRDDL